MKVLSLVDSFKGTLSSIAIGQIIKEELNKADIECDYIPVSDGGEGLIVNLSHIFNISSLSIESIGALGKKDISQYLFNPKTSELFIELAQIVGIERISRKKRNAFVASTYGLGKVIKETIELHNPKKVYIGLGSSASIDLGVGMLEGLGVKFYDKNNDLISFIGNKKLSDIFYYDTSSLKQYEGIEFFALNDANISLFSSDGAINNYSIQKGAKKEDIPSIWLNAESFINTSSRIENRDMKDFVGSGAAGGVAYSLKYFLGAKMINGVTWLFNLMNLSTIMDDYDLIITGEGKVDNQSFQGKLISGVLSLNKKTIIICAIKDKSIHMPNLYSIVPTVATNNESFMHPKKSLRKLISSINWSKIVSGY